MIANPVEKLRRAIGTAIVDHDDFIVRCAFERGGQRCEATLGEIQAIVRGDQEADVRPCHAAAVVRGGLPANAEVLMDEG